MKVCKNFNNTVFADSKAAPETPVTADDSDCEELPLSALVALEKGDAEAGLPPDTEYVIGYRLEAKDFNEDW